MWPELPEAQAYALLMLSAVVAIVGLLWTIAAERRWWRRKLARIGERHHERLTGLRNDLNWALSEVERLRPTTVEQHLQATPAWAATRSAEQTVVAGGRNPELTHYIPTTDDGSVTT